MESESQDAGPSTALFFPARKTHTHDRSFLQLFSVLLLLFFFENFKHTQKIEHWNPSSSGLTIPKFFPVPQSPSLVFMSARVFQSKSPVRVHYVFLTYDDFEKEPYLGHLGGSVS